MAKKQTRTTEKNQRNKDSYDQVLLNLPKGTKDQLKDISSTIGISVNEYINRLIKHDLDNDHKHEDMVIMLNRWEVKEKYHPMIESASYTKGQGYFIRLKNGFCNDHSESNEIICRTTKQLRHIMQFTHPVRTPDEMCGFDSKTYEQLLRWQVSKGYFKGIAGVGDHQIIFKNGNVWKFKSVAELRYMWKASKEGH